VSSLTDDICVLLARDLEGLQREVELFPDDHTLWSTGPGVTNSAGNLARHIAGNLRYFIGDALGGIRYRRDREAEFGARSGSRREIIEEVGRALTVVHDVLPGVTPAQLAAPFEAHPGIRVSTQRFLLHLCTHTAFHVGQVGYLRRLLTGDSRTTNTVSSSRLESASASGGGLSGT
jgi:uncharacterized damage-inducible protein DinB